ncbi:MAG: DNA repair protein RadC [Armatimonadetes bacterium]|nr:DNA repair protein RadC [Armatimonadota bacterium]
MNVYEAMPSPLSEGAMPREKLQTQDIRTMEDRELLALLLGTGARGKSVFQLADELVREGILRSRVPTVDELCRVPGIGPARASAVVAGLELGRRAHQPAGPPVSCPEEAYAFLSGMSELRQEHFRGLYLDARRRLLQDITISIGTLTASLVHPREVFRPALECSAASLVVAHNHPSGDSTPSREDLSLTRRLKRAGDILGIELLDHLIIGRGEFVSLKELGEC